MSCQATPALRALALLLLALIPGLLAPNAWAQQPRREAGVDIALQPVAMPRGSLLQARLRALALRA